VLHDWPDEIGAKILARVKEAMKPGYSRLIINENVISPTNAYWEITGLDIMMLGLNGSAERTESNWRHLIEDMAGLKILQIWSVPNGVEKVIECEVPEQSTPSVSEITQDTPSVSPCNPPPLDQERDDISRDTTDSFPQATAQSNMEDGRTEAMS
jgi:hypothetical protein